MSALMTTLVLGGARSGKSAFAERLVRDSALQRIYLATATAGDDEMQARISHHRIQRGDGWRTIEEPLELVPTLARESAKDRAVLVDCLTLWLSNLMHAERDWEREIEELAGALPRLKSPVVLVTNEVGLGIVPDNALARSFRDAAGIMNQVIAEVADEVEFVVAGLPMKLK
jgi:adenosylcobinamide kinase/adenosylcobinamide-phosphate guanylyltransferase